LNLKANGYINELVYKFITEKKNARIANVKAILWNTTARLLKTVHYIQQQFE
jgi:hypothetical protein